MNILIADDDLYFVNKLKKDIQSFFNFYISDLSFTIKIKNFYSLDADKIDIAFIDIDLKTENGLSYAKYLKKNNPNMILIFVSNNEGLVFQTLSIGIFQFIRKTKYSKDVLIVFNQLNNYIIDKYNPKIINVNGYKHLIKIVEIEYILSIGKDMLIRTKKEEYVIQSSIKKILEFFDSSLLLQIQRGLIINYAYIKKVYKNKVYTLDGKEYKISKKYFDDFLKKYEELLLS